MKIAFFALSPRADGGVYQYTLAAIDAFKQIAVKDSRCLITFFYSMDYSEYFRNMDVHWAQVALSQAGIKGDVFLATYLGRGLRGLNEKSFDLAISPKTCLIGYKTARKCVVTLHDLQHKRLPHYFRFYRNILRDVLYSRSVNLSDVTICETNHVKQDIVTYYGIEPAKIRILPSPPPSYIVNVHVDDWMLRRVRERYSLPSEFLFYPAQFWFHKNHIRLFQAMHVLRSVNRLDVPLVLVGAERNSFREAMGEMHRLGLASRVTYLGYVPDHEMPCLFKLSSGVILPTLFESLSIPVWEAFSLGVPVACSNIGSLLEQAGDAAIFFDPYEPQDIARGMAELLVASARSQVLVRRGKQKLADLTSEKYAHSWMQLIEGLKS